MSARLRHGEDRELVALRKALGALPDLADRALRRLEDLYSVAFDRQVSDGAHVSVSREGWYLDEVGEARAKQAWRELTKSVLASCRDLVAVEARVSELLAAGEGAQQLRGTLLGDDGLTLVTRPRRQLELLDAAMTEAERAARDDERVVVDAANESRVVAASRSAAEELADVLAAQRRRRERGEYTPERSGAQPKVPRR